MRHSGCNVPKRPMRTPLPTPARATALEAAHTLAAHPPNHSLPLSGGCCQGRVSRV